VRYAGTPAYPSGVHLRVEQESDQPAVRRVHLRAFGDHGRSVADLVEALRPSITPAAGLSLVAEEQGDVVGHVMFTRVWLDAPRRLVEVQSLSPLAVLPGHQGRGVGGALVRRGLEIMAEQRVPVVFLEGPPAYYSRFGFAAGAGQGFRRPSLRIPEAAFQAIRLPTCEAWMTGTMVYPDTFWRHDAVGMRDPGA
jgi:putative acetyltransferase